MSPTYSFGEDSPMKFQISDKMAENYNQAVHEFFKAQGRFKQKFGRQWDPKVDPIQIRWTSKQQKAWNKFGKVMNDVIKRDGPFHENDIMDDFLIKNVAQTVSKVSDGFGRILTLVVGSAVAYVLLRGL